MKLKEILTYPIRECGQMFAFCLLMELVILAVCHILGLGGSVFLGILLPIFDCYVICITASLLKKIRLGWIMWIVCVAVFAGELFTVLFYKSTFSIRVLQLVMETNAQEASEFFHSALVNTSFWGMLLLIALTVTASIGIIKLERRLIPLIKNIVCYLGLFPILWSGTRQIPAYIKLGRCLTAKQYSLFTERRYMPHLSTTCVRLIHSIAFNMAQTSELDALTETVRNTEHVKSSRKCPLIVLIIGESFSKYHTPLYNPTAPSVNPRLCKLRENGNLIPYTDVITTSNLTSNVMRNMFSMWDEEYNDNWTDHTLFPAIFRKAGYQVIYLSNQFVLDSNDTWNGVGGTIFNRHELSECQFDIRNDKIRDYDLELLDMMPDTTQLFSLPTLLIVHLMGQHVKYVARYPESFRHFTVDSVNTGFGGQGARKIIAEYANATLYNDFVVDSIWSIVKGHDAVGIYMSDHGEELYDWRDFHERTDERQMSKEVARYQFEIPFMFIMSDSFIANHPQIAGQIRNSCDKSFINSRVKHVLLGLAGIETHEYKPEQDILTDTYDTRKARLIGDHINYDSLMRK